MSRVGSAGATAGFTVLEMLIALVVLALAMSGIGAILPDSRERRNLSEADVNISEGLSRARAGAQKTGYPHLMVFYPRHVAVTAHHQIWAKHLPAGVAVSVVSAQELKRDGHPGIAFFGDGSSTGARIELQSGSRTTVRSVHWLDGGDRGG